MPDHQHQSKIKMTPARIDEMHKLIESGPTQKETAEKLGMSFATANNYASGRRRPASRADGSDARRTSHYQPLSRRSQRVSGPAKTDPIGRRGIIPFTIIIQRQIGAVRVC